MLDQQWLADTNALLYRIQQQDRVALKTLYDIGSKKLAALITAIIKDKHMDGDSQ